MSDVLSLSTVHRNAAGWFRGDFHCHTNHSDGVLLPPELLALARTEGLDFFAMTDHNGVDAYGGFGDQDGFLIIPGIEVTYKEGHFNVFGLADGAAWVEELRAGAQWFVAELGGNYPTMSDVMRATHARGWLNSINHPLLTPWEWRDMDTDVRLLDCLEVWNDPSWIDNKAANPQAVQLWTRLLNAGYRITAIGGSDFHRPTPQPGVTKPAERLGTPSTYVYADELSGAAILDGLRAHRAYVSMGPQAAFTARLDNQEYEIGADVGTAAGEVVLNGSVTGSPRPGTARIVRGGSRNDELALELQDGHCALEWRAQVNEGEWGWFRLEAWDTEGQMLALTNPVYFGAPQEPAQHRFGDFL